MARRYHSPSSAELGARCQRAWAHCYVDGMREPSVDWDEAMADKLPPGVTSKQRSAALGVAAHAVLEAWYLGGTPAWHSYPGRVVEAGRHLLPAPDEVIAVVESPLGDEPVPDAEADDDVQTGIRVGGVLWAGFRDLVASGPGLARLGIPGEVALFDYKTTASIARYAKDAATLAADLQCNLYAYATMKREGLRVLACRWVYFETKAVRRALPTDIAVELAAAEDRVNAAAELCRELDSLERSADAPMNVNACRDYGGCSYHESKGGPCPGEGFSFVSVLDLNKERRSMALTPEQQAAFDKFRKKPAEAEAPSAPEPPAEAPSAPEPPADAPSAAKPPADETPAEKPAPKKRAAKAATPAPAGSLAEEIAVFQAEIASAEADLLAARQRLDTAVNGLRARLA